MDTQHINDREMIVLVTLLGTFDEGAVKDMVSQTYEFRGVLSQLEKGQVLTGKEKQKVLSMLESVTEIVRNL
jgi:hypothetical protein